MVRVAITVEQNWNAVPGGTGRSVNRLIEALSTHTTTDLVGLAGKHRRQPVLELPTGLSVVTIPIPGRLLLESWSRFGRPSVDRFIDGADVLHGPAYFLPSSSLPSVVTIHDLIFRHRPDWFTPHGVRFLERFLQLVVRSSSAVIVPSQVTADDCVDAGIEADRIAVIPWGVDPTRVSADEASEIADRLGLPETFVLYVGTIEPRKNLPKLIEAVRLLDSVPLVVVGVRGWGDIELGDVKVVADLTDREVAAVMAAARVLAYPSVMEGFGLPVLEAMAQGTPVVVSDGTAPAHVAGDAGLAVNPDDVGSLAAAIESVATDDPLHDQLTRAALDRVRSFEWAHTARATAEVYERLASGDDR